MGVHYGRTTARRHLHKTNRCDDLRHLYILMFQNGSAKKVTGFRAVYKTRSNSTCQYPRVSGGVWRCLLSSVDIVSSLEMSGGCLGDVRGISGGI